MNIKNQADLDQGGCCNAAVVIHAFIHSEQVSEFYITDTNHSCGNLPTLFFFSMQSYFLHSHLFRLYSISLRDLKVYYFSQLFSFQMFNALSKSVNSRHMETYMK